MAYRLSKILVPVDGSTSANKAAAFAAMLARSTGASLTLLYVISAESMTLQGAVAVTQEEIQNAMERLAGPALDAAAREIGDDVEAETRSVVGKPSMEIIDHAKAEGIDLIVMGSRGLSDLRELLVGSVSSQVLHHAPCSVTIVR